MAKSGGSDEEDIEVEQSGEACSTISKPVKTSTPISLIIQSLIKNLCSIYEHDEKNARDLYNLICSKLYETMIIDESYRMNEFEGMRNEYQRAFHRLLSSARGDENGVPLHPIWPSNDVTSEWSHYYREFEEVAYIAGGGFGKVFRVKHKLDGTEYAVKKIFIRSEGIKSVMSYLSEVKTFASLNHSNIVQYKAAWLELGAASDNHAILDSTTDEDDYTSKTSSGKIDDHIETYIYPTQTEDIDITFKNEDSSDFRVSFEKSWHNSYSNSKEGTKTKRTKRSSISEGGNAICTVEEIRRLSKPQHQKWATLYIQMSLCQSTLRQWLEKRNNNLEDSEQKESAIVPVINHNKISTVMEILRQLLKGLEYIHSKGIVHHDIKPSNIFVQLEMGSLLVQLGDFGLACPLQSTRHSLAFGTKLYAAPEQLSGKCDPKSDMYSLGIVALELAETFRTDMERVHSITELRKGHLPASLIKQQPQLAQIISQLVVRYPSERPDAADLLKVLTVNVVESELVQDLQMKIKEKDEEIDRLRELLKTAGIQGV